MLKKSSLALIHAKELLPNRSSMMFCLSMKCLLEMNLLIEMFNFYLWQTCLTVPQAQPTQWKMCQHEQVPSLT